MSLAKGSRKRVEQIEKGRKMIISVDITSDIMCPWCIIGFKRLQKAMEQFENSIEFNLHWCPFELNPRMPASGQNLYVWLYERYGMTQDAIVSSRRELTEIGKELGFTFNYSKNTRMYNTLSAHQLLHWAGENSGKQTELKMALFEAHFSQGLNISDQRVLLRISENIGLDVIKAKSVLNDKPYESTVRRIEREIKRQGINAVPTFLFNQQYKVEGAQRSSVFEAIIKKLISANGNQRHTIPQI